MLKWVANMERLSWSWLWRPETFHWGNGARARVRLAEFGMRSIVQKIQL